MDLHKKKEVLRERLLKQRKAISDADFEQHSLQIIQKVREEDDFSKADTVHCYVSMNARGEVETRRFIRGMLQGDKKEVVVPITNFEEGTLSHIRLSSFDQLESNKWGVLEPRKGEEVSPSVLDLVIVPMVGGDEHCNRIGYGKGFYDRFLREVGCPKIGLIFDQNIVSRLPAEKFDIPLDKIITEKRIIQRD